MGIKGLLPFLRTQAPGAFRRAKPAADVRGKRIAVDANGLLWRYKLSPVHGQKWLRSLGEFAKKLAEMGALAVFVFDGVPPEIKSDTNAERAVRREDTKRKAEESQAALNELFMPPSLRAGPAPAAVDDATMRRHMANIHAANHPTRADSEDAIAYLRSRGVRSLRARGEAEETCCGMLARGEADIVLSLDSDVLAYTAVRCALMMNARSSGMEFVCKDTLCRELGVSHESFTDMCIMFGTDYNPNVPNVGPKRAHAWICAHASLDVAPDGWKDVLKYEAARAVFRGDVYQEPVEDQDDS